MKTDGRDARKTDRNLERGEIITNEIKTAQGYIRSAKTILGGLSNSKKHAIFLKSEKKCEPPPLCRFVRPLSHTKKVGVL